MSVAICEHLSGPISIPAPGTPNGCAECLATGDSWVHLRLCVGCGHVGCCDQSKNRHATKHYAAAAHPVIASYEPGEAWMWCYPDQLFAETATSVR